MVAQKTAEKGKEEQEEENEEERQTIRAEEVVEAIYSRARTHKRMHSRTHAYSDADAHVSRRRHSLERRRRMGHDAVRGRRVSMSANEDGGVPVKAKKLR